MHPARRRCWENTITTTTSTSTSTTSTSAQAQAHIHKHKLDNRPQRSSSRHSYVHAGGSRSGACARGRVRGDPRECTLQDPKGARGHQNCGQKHSRSPRCGRQEQLMCRIPVRQNARGVDKGERGRKRRCTHKASSRTPVVEPVRPQDGGLAESSPCGGVQGRSFAE